MKYALISISIVIAVWAMYLIVESEASEKSLRPLTCIEGLNPVLITSESQTISGPSAEVDKLVDYLRAKKSDIFLHNLLSYIT